MSDKMITICGKEISESTVVEALKKHCGFDDFDESKTPVFSTVKDCLVIKLTSEVSSDLDTAIKNNSPYIALNKDGSWEWGFYTDETFQDVIKHFRGTPKPLFE